MQRQNEKDKDDQIHRTDLKSDSESELKSETWLELKSELESDTE